MVDLQFTTKYPICYDQEYSLCMGKNETANETARYTYIVGFKNEHVLGLRKLN
jgi:hypothetical protein